MPEPKADLETSDGIDLETFKQVYAALVAPLTKAKGTPRERRSRSVPRVVAECRLVAEHLEDHNAGATDWERAEAALKQASSDVDPPWNEVIIIFAGLDPDYADAQLTVRNTALSKHIASLRNTPRKDPVRWANSPLVGALKPGQYATALLAAALLEADSPGRYVEEVYVPACAPAASPARPQKDPDEADDHAETADENTYTPGVIVDPIHGYIPFTSLEAAILRLPAVQRLKHIAQMACSHHVFPSANTTRFEHSIGAMHVVSRLFRASLCHADDDFRDTVVEAICGLAGDDYVLEGELVDSQRRQFGLQETALLRSGLTRPEVGDRRQRVALLLVEQALRIATLLHDLGHLPFSHDMELVLGDITTAGGHGDWASERWPALTFHARRGTPEQLHELLGQQIGNLLLWTWASTTDTESGLGLDPELRRLAQVAVNLAKKLAVDPRATKESSREDLCRGWLYSLINGELDADRCDYVLRDGRSHSIPGASFDLDRLVRATILCESSDGGWVLALKGSGVGAFEELLVARWRLYVWGIYHHKAQSLALALRSGLKRLLSPEFLVEPTDPAWDESQKKDHERKRAASLISLIDAVDDLVALSYAGSPKSVPEPVGRARLNGRLALAVHGTWWDSRVAELFRQYWEEYDDNWAGDMRAFALRQELPGYQPLWKRGTDLGASHIRKLNDTVDGPGFLEWRTNCEANGISVVRLPFTPVAREPSGVSEMRVVAGGVLVPVSERSSLINALSDAWHGEPHAYAFVSGDDWTDSASRGKIGKSTIDRLK